MLKLLDEVVHLIQYDKAGKEAWVSLPPVNKIFLYA